MRGFIGFCLLLTGLSIGAYSHYPGPAHREASLAELTEIVTGAIHNPDQIGTLARPANASELDSARKRRDQALATRNATDQGPTRDGFQRRGWFASSDLLVAGQDAQRNTATRLAAKQKTKPRVLAIEEPPKLIRQAQRPSSHTVASHTAPSPSANPSGWRTAVVQVGAAPTTKSDKRPQSLKPTTHAERWKLVKSLQAELKRVGCYWGKVDGVWGKGSKWAMADFMRSVNAALPTMDPDYIQLQLISSHANQVCGRGNTRQQIAAVAKPKLLQKPQWRTQVARARDKTSGSSPYRRPTGTVPSEARVANAAQRRPAPLPGRMAVGVLNNSAPKLTSLPKRETRHTNVPSRPTTAANTRTQQQLKISALTKPQPDPSLEGQPARGNSFDAATNVNQPTRSKQVNPYVARKRSAAKARRAAAVRKANVRKKRRRYYRRRYRRRSVQSMFMHPLGRR